MIKVAISQNERHIMPTSHFHEYYELYFLISGDVTHFVEENTYRVTDDEVVIVAPKVIHRTTAIHSDTRTRAILCFSADELDAMEHEETGITSFLKNIIVSCRKKRFEQIAEILDKMLLEQENENSHVLQRAYLYELLIMLKRQAKTGISSMRSNEGVDIKIQSVIKYINENYSEVLTLEKLAKRFFVSSAYLSRRFKKTTGFSYIEYLVNLRAKKAAEFLETTNRSITEIAVSVGFGSSNHFCKTFKKIMGQSPAAYRSLHKSAKTKNGMIVHNQTNIKEE